LVQFKNKQGSCKMTVHLIVW